MCDVACTIVLNRMDVLDALGVHVALLLHNQGAQ